MGNYFKLIKLSKFRDPFSNTGKSSSKIQLCCSSFTFESLSNTISKWNAFRTQPGINRGCCTGSRASRQAQSVTGRVKTLRPFQPIQKFSLDWKSVKPCAVSGHQRLEFSMILHGSKRLPQHLQWGCVRPSEWFRLAKETHETLMELGHIFKLLNDLFALAHEDATVLGKFPFTAGSSYASAHLPQLLEQKQAASYFLLARPALYSRTLPVSSHPRSQSTTAQPRIKKHNCWSSKTTIVGNPRLLRQSLCNLAGGHPFQGSSVGRPRWKEIWLKNFAVTNFQLSMAQYDWGSSNSWWNHNRLTRKLQSCNVLQCLQRRGLKIIFDFRR